MNHKLALFTLTFFTLLAAATYSSTAFNLDFSYSDTVSMDLKQGDSVTYIHGDENYILFLSDMTEDSIVLEINQEPFVLMIGKDVAVDVDMNGVFDLRIAVDSIKGESASVIFTQTYITEPHKDVEIGIVTVNVTERKSWATGLLVLSPIGQGGFMLVLAVLGLLILIKYKFLKALK